VTKGVFLGGMRVGHEWGEENNHRVAKVTKNMILQEEPVRNVIA